MHLIQHTLGLDNASGPIYLWWSGFFGDIGEFAILGVLWHRLNCHAKGCYRIGLHHVEGTPYITCRKHHPTAQKGATAEHIHLDYRKHKEVK